MKNSLLVVLLLFLGIKPGLSESAAADQGIIEIHNIQDKLNLNHLLWYQEDSKAEYTAADFADPSFQRRFAPLDRKTTNFGLSGSAWWAKATVRNAKPHPVILYITQEYAQVDFMDFWQLSTGGATIAHVRGGDRAAKDPNAPSYRLPAIRMELPPGDSILVIRMQTNGSGLFYINASTEAYFFDNKTNEYAFVYAMLAILACMTVYNFCIWLQLRKAEYFVYVMFIITMALQQGGFSGLSVHFMESSWFMNEGAYLFTVLSVMSACLFTIMFLSLDRRHPWLRMACWISFGLPVLASLGLLQSYNMGLRLMILATFVAALAITAAGLFCCWKRYRPAYFFTGAWLAVLIASVIRSSMLAGSFPVNFVSQWGSLIGTVLEVMLLSLAIADKIRITEKNAFDKIENLNAELTKEHEIVVSLNNNLERMVEEQTREIKSILRHIQIGILVVRKENLEITETHSVSAQHLFNVNQIAGRNAIDLIFGNAQLSREVASQADSVLRSCLGENALNFDVNSHLLPSEARFRFGQDERIMQLDWNPVVDKEGIIEKFLVSVKDVTALKQLESEAAEKAKELTFIGEILDVSARQFGIFINSSQRFMADNIRLLKANVKAKQEVLKILFINMHTIKGAARALGLKQLTPVIHEVEQNLSAVLKNSRDWDRDTLLADHVRVSALLDQYQDLNQCKLGRTSSDVISLTVDFTQRLRQALLAAESEGTAGLRLKVKPIRESIDELAFVRAESIFREVLSNSEMLARDLQKEAPCIDIHDDAVQLTTEGQELIRNAFIHIIRNSMDHGIENADERISRGKSAEGHIDVRLEIADGQLQIHYRDDGRGLNLRAIRRLAAQRGLIAEDQRLSDLDIAYLIFEPGLSTCETTSDISGRGVGMSAVKEYVCAEGGSAEIRLLKNDKVVDPDFIPFEFVFAIGSRFFLQRAA